MCEGVSEDSRHGAWHVVIHVEMCMFLLECVWMCEHGIACALRWEVTLVGDFLCRTLLIPSWNYPFRYTRRRRSFEAMSTKKAGLWPREVFL